MLRDVIHEAARSSSKAEIRSTRFLNLSRSAAFQAGVVADRWRRLGAWVYHRDKAARQKAHAKEALAKSSAAERDVC